MMMISANWSHLRPRLLATKNNRWQPQLLGAVLLAQLLFLLSGCSRSSPFKEAEEQQQQGHYTRAIDGFRSYYLDNPFTKQAPQALWNIGNIYRLNLKDFKKAAEAYKVLVNRFPESKQARSAQMMLGDLYAQQFQDYEQAVVEYQRVVIGKGYSNQEKAEAKLQTGNAYFTIGNFQQARIEYEGLKQLYPDSLQAKRAILQLAHTYDSDADYNNALSLYKQVADLKTPTELPAEITNNAENLRNLQQAYADLAVQGTFGVASCYEEMGRYEEALRAFQEVIDKYPSRRVVEIRMDRLKQRMNNVNKDAVTNVP